MGNHVLLANDTVLFTDHATNSVEVLFFLDQGKNAYALLSARTTLKLRKII